MKVVKILIAIIFLVFIAAMIAGMTSGEAKQAASPSPALAAAEVKIVPVHVVANRSRCWYTGIDDPYTGDGHVGFYVTVRNDGTESGSIDLTPVRFYDDGQENRSAMNTVTITVPAGQMIGGRLDVDTYEAHEHEVEGCAVEVDGNDEPIRSDYVGS